MVDAAEPGPPDDTGAVAVCWAAAAAIWIARAGLAFGAAALTPGADDALTNAGGGPSCRPSSFAGGVTGIGPLLGTGATG